VKKSSPSSNNKNNRRNFLKSQLIIGLGACTTGLGISGAYSSPAPALSSDFVPADELRNKYLACLGGPFPDFTLLKTKVREIIQKDGYRIESLTYEALPGNRIPALLLVPDKVNKENILLCVLCEKFLKCISRKVRKDF